MACVIRQLSLLYSWRFSRYSAPIHWLVHGHMTSNNETVSRQMPWAGNIAKTMMSNGKQFTVTREILITVACDQSVQLTWRWHDVVAGMSARFFKICFSFVFLYNKSLNDWLSRETLRNSFFPSGSVISVCYHVIIVRTQKAHNVLKNAVSSRNRTIFWHIIGLSKRNQPRRSYSS